MFTYLIPFVFYFFTFGIFFWIPPSKLLSVTFKILPSYSFIHGVFAPRLSLGGEGLWHPVLCSPWDPQAPALCAAPSKFTAFCGLPTSPSALALPNLKLDTPCSSRMIFYITSEWRHFRLIQRSLSTYLWALLKPEKENNSKSHPGQVQLEPVALSGPVPSDAERNPNNLSLSPASASEALCEHR